MLSALFAERRRCAPRLLAITILALILLPLLTLGAYADAPAAAAPPSLAALVMQGGPAALIVTALVSLAASLFCAVTPTPTPGSRWAGIYQLVELLAVITRHTKQTGIPAVDALNLAAGAVEGLKPEPPKEPAPALAETVKQAIVLFAVLGAAGLGLVACSSAQVQQAQTKANEAVAKAGPDVAMACWLVQAADAGFKAYAASPNSKVSAADAADEAKAIAAANVTCASPPQNAAGVVAALLATYKTVVGMTVPPAAAASAKS